MTACVFQLAVSVRRLFLGKASFIYLDKSVVQIHFYRDKNVPGLFLEDYLYLLYSHTQKYKPIKYT